MVYLRSIHVSEQVCTYVHRRINGAELASHHGSPLLGNIPVRVKRELIGTYFPDISENAYSHIEHTFSTWYNVVHKAGGR